MGLSHSRDDESQHDPATVYDDRVNPSEDSLRVGFTCKDCEPGAAWGAGVILPNGHQDWCAKFGDGPDTDRDNGCNCSTNSELSGKQVGQSAVDLHDASCGGMDPCDKGHTRQRYADWQHEVANGDTRLGFTEFCEHRADEEQAWRVADLNERRADEEESDGLVHLIKGPTVDGETLYWSNVTGWGSREGATRFTDEEHATMGLPLEAVGWVYMADEGKSDA